LGGEKMNNNKNNKRKTNLAFSILNKSNHYKRILCLVLLITFFINYLPGEFMHFTENVSAEQKVFEVQEFQEKIYIPYNGYKAIDINFLNGNELEVIFNLQVKGAFPIDIWFVNEDNYLLLTNGAQFLYFIDGTGQQISYANKIVIINEHDIYKLVMTNYNNNQTVEVDIIGELRTIRIDSKESSSNGISDLNDSEIIIIISSLVITITILVSLIIVLGFKIKRNKLYETQKLDKKSPKKSKPNKSKKDKVKDKGKDLDKKKNNKNLLSKKNKIIKGTTASFCGYCGESVDTPFCKYCGKKN
jgi:hypothetical protein